MPVHPYDVSQVRATVGGVPIAGHAPDEFSSPPVSPALARARASKLAMRAADRMAREARKAWTGLRGSLAAEPAIVSTMTDKEVVGRLTLAMWSAEVRFAACVDAWRLALSEREAMPVADRWSLVGLDKWARAQEVQASLGPLVDTASAPLLALSGTVKP
jgi:hypothetical protein